MRISVRPETAYHLINHGPCALITTGDGAARNVAPINWTMPIMDEPPLVLMAIEPGIFTDELLRRNGEFAVNVMGEKHAAQTLFCGRRSGRDVDKFEGARLTPAPCRTIKPPRLAESLGHLECRVQNTHGYDAEGRPSPEPPSEGGIILYVGRVVHAEAEEEFFDGTHLRAEAAKTIHHLGSGIFAVSDRVIRVPREKS
jgi:flavin reductase (DIM6/NTAB) family NADH-FMN oxidoreductase RutF